MTWWQITGLGLFVLALWVVAAIGGNLIGFFIRTLWVRIWWSVFRVRPVMLDREVLDATVEDSVRHWRKLWERRPDIQRFRVIDKEHYEEEAARASDELRRFMRD